MLQRLHTLETFGIKLGLENIRRLCAALDHPERAFTTLHVAGTNGKGSVTAFVHAGLIAAGIHAARYTSPHLTELRERFVVGSGPVDPITLETVGTLVLDTADDLVARGELAAPPTFFEATTAMAFELFRRSRVQVAVIEVGLGGRFDATNVVMPPAGAITSIALDHQEHLGSTISDIAFEKAGIIKPGMTVVLGDLPEDADAVMVRAAQERGAELVRSGSGVRIDATFAQGVSTVTITTQAAAYGPVALSLRGEHQIKNAVVAVRLLEAAREAGVRIPDAAIIAGLRTAEWPGRLELLQVGPGKRLLMDGAHNVQGARALAAYLRQWHPERPTLVFGVMADKDVNGILAELLPVTSTVIATAVSNRRAMPAVELGRRVTEVEPARRVEAVPSPLDAVRRGLDVSSGVVCVAGSLYLAGAVREAANQRAILH